MKPSSRSRTGISGLWALLGAAALGVAGCGAPENFGEDEPIGRAQEAIDPGWQFLSLATGWSNYNGSSRTPSIGTVNGVVTLRGAIKGSSTAGLVVFTMPAAFRPSSPCAGSMDLRTILRNGTGGTLVYNNASFEVKVYQDGWSNSTPGADAKGMTSLDGVAFDLVCGEVLEPGNEWRSRYPYRQDDEAHSSFVKQTSDKFVRFQGFTERPLGSSNPDGFLFNIPSSYRPGNTVFVPINLAGNSASQAWGYISIDPNGDVYVPWNVPAANKGTSLEGAWFSRTISGNEPLDLDNGWGNYSARSVKVGKYGDVVRFQGAVSGGTDEIIGTLPTNMRPSKDVYVVGVANGPAPAKLVVRTSGDIEVLYPPLNVATIMVSLDGVSFWL